MGNRYGDNQAGSNRKFFMLSNMIMMDGSLAINERGLLVTLYSLPKTWDFSIRGMTKILPNGERAITTALRKLESKRYVKCTYYRGKNGRFKTDIELFYHVKNAKNSGIFAEIDNVENLDEDSAAIEEITVEEVEENATPEESHVNPIDDCKIEKTHENPVKEPKTFKEQLVAMIAKRNDENRTNTVTPCLKFSRKVRKNTEKFIKKDKMNKYNNNNNITDMKNVTPKGKDIGIREIIADHNNKRLVYDEKAQNFIKSHIDDIEKLSGRSVKKYNTDEYLKKIKSVAKEAKTKDITNDITV